MAFFKQLRLLLKHKILLRRRQPTTLLLELFWPAFVFLAILVVRWHFPPTFRQTCYYNAKALPSAGMVNLLQSYVCNLDNPCLNGTEYQQVPNYPNASIHSIVDQLLPLVTNKNVTGVINDLPKGIRLIAAIIDTLSITSVQNLFEDGFPLRKALRPSGWKRVEQELNRLDATMVPFSDLDLVTYADSIENYSTHDILVNASLNLMQLGVQSDGSGFRSVRSFRDLICDYTQLEKFLIVDDKRHLRFLSRHLCLLERKDLYYLFDLAQENIDFGQILEQLSIIFRSVGLTEHQQHVDNIIAMINTIDRANIFRSMSALRNTSWMYDVPKLFDVLRSGDIDMMTLLKVVNDIEPIFNNDESTVNEQFKKLNDRQRKQQLDSLIHLYNLDDSSLRNVANLAFGGGVYGFNHSDSSSTTEYPSTSDWLDDDEEDEEDEEEEENLPSLQHIGDLDTSESHVSQLSTKPTSRNDPTTGNVQNESLSRKFLPKLVANMDKLIDGIETFTKTPQWESLLSGFQGLQMLLEMAEDAADDPSGAKNKLSSMKIEKFILGLPKKIQTFNNFFNSVVPEKIQNLLSPLFDLFYRGSDSMLQHLSGAFSRALAEDKIYYFDRFAQFLLATINNGTIPRKCGIMQEAMCNFDKFQSVFVNNVDEDSSEMPVLYDADTGTLQGIQELGCLFFGQNYTQNVEESTPILAKLYYTLSSLNETNLLSSFSSSSSFSNSSSTSTSSDETTWTNFTSRMLEVYLLATKSVNANTWDMIFGDANSIWKSNGMTDRLILVSRILQLSADCFIPKRIVQSSIWRAIYRKNAIANEMLNVLLDEINDSTETEALKVEQISMGSLTLKRFLMENLRIVPTLIDATIDTIFFNLPKFVEKLFQFYSNFVSGWPCNRNSLIDILSLTDQSAVSQIYQFEEFLCQQFQMSYGDSGRIVDELIDSANNESRIAPLIRAIQSKSTDPVSIHENLSPLDWVEVATSVSLIKDSVEKIISMDNTLALFPEVDQLDNQIHDSFNRGHSQFLRFYTQGNVGLIAYLGDIVTPFAIRSLSLNETFSTTCDNGVSGTLMAPVYNDKEWRCSFGSFKYASYTIKHLFGILNDVLENFLYITGQVTSMESGSKFEPTRSCSLIGKFATNSGRYLMLTDNIPEILELFLNEVLIGDIERLSRTGTLHQLICSSNLNLDVFGPRRVLYDDIRNSLCELSTEVGPCMSLTMPERWQSAFDHLNETWYEQSPETLTAKASFTEAYHSFYRFLTLFGQFSPKFFNNFMAKFQSTDAQNYVSDILNRLNRLDYFRNKRYAYVMQTTAHELNTVLFDERQPQNYRHIQDRRDLLMALIYAFNELPVRLRQRYKLGSIYVKTATSTGVDDDLLHVDLLDSLLDWLDGHLLIASETFLQTITLDIQRLLKLFYNRYDTVTVWRSFCRSPVSQYFVVDNQISVSANKAKEEICQLDFNAVYDQWYRNGRLYLANYTNQELISVLLVKVGSFLDLVLGDNIYKRDLLKSDEWQPILSKLNRLVLSSIDNDANNAWLTEAIANFIQQIFSKQLVELVQNGFKRLECGLDTISSTGLNWELVPTVYRNKTDVMALYSSLNSVFQLGTIGLNTFLSQTKFYNHVQLIAKAGKKGFCELKTDQEFDKVFSIMPTSSSNQAISALNNLQTLLCKSSEQFLYHMNPVSKCFDQSLSLQAIQSTSFKEDLKTFQAKFSSLFWKSSPKSDVDSTDRSTAVVVPSILDIKQWSLFFKWWSQEVAPYPNSSRTLLAMRVFQLVDAFADNHVIWKAFYRLTFFSSEMFAYSLRALQLSEAMYPMKPDLKFLSNKFGQLNSTFKHSKKGMSSLLTSTVSNLIFPEVNHFITFATFRQLRWIRHISHFFAKHPNILHDELCPTLNSINNQKMVNNSPTSPVIVDDDFNDLLLLLCHNHPADWIYTLTFKSNLFNIKSSPRPKLMSHRRIRERIGKLTQVLARMLDYNSSKNDQQLDHVVRFLKLKQLESIENVAGTASILTETVFASQKPINGSNIKSSFRELLITSWRSVPTLLDAVDQYICSYRRSDIKLSKQNETSDDDSAYSNRFFYKPKAPDMRVVMCDMPRWDFDRAYTYLSKHLDLKNMLQVFASTNMVNTDVNSFGCVTPLRFMSRWVDVGQDIFEQLSTSSFWSELKSCRRRHLLTLLASTKSKSNTFLLKNSLRYIRFTNGLLSTVNKFSHDSSGISWNNVRELWRTFSYFVLNQVPAYVPITDIIRHDVNLPEYLNATLDRISTLSRSRAKQAIRLITDSLLDINAVSWNNFSNIALKEMICKEQNNLKVTLDTKHYLPIIISRNIKMANISSYESLYETLCQSGNLNQIIESLISALDQKSIKSRLLGYQRSELSRTDWMSDVFVPEMSQLSSEMSSSGMLADINNKIGLFHSPNEAKSESASQKGINHLLISFVSLTRAKNFNTLYDTIKHVIDKLMPRFSEGPIVDSLSRILQGLRSLKDLSNRGLFQVKYNLSELLVNVENVKIFLELNLGLHKSAINQILNATIDLSEFIEQSASISFGSNVFCNQTLLFDDLKLQLPTSTGTTVNQETVTNALCTLSITEDFKFNNQILNQLVIRKLTSNVVNLIMNGLLQKAKIESNEIGKALNAVRASSRAMPHVKKFIRDFSKSFEMFDDSIGQLNWSSMSGGLQNISLSNASDLIGKIMCDRSLPALNREIKLLKVKVQNPKVSTNDLNTFSSDFCRNGYKQIMQMQGGSVIWNFLKPILVGKILYTPKAPATDMIMSHMNTTLRFMPRIVEMLYAWSQTLSSLETFYYESDINNRMTHVKHLVETIFVNGEADGLFDDIDTFNLIERMTRSGNILAILKLIGQVSQCASFNRFVGLENELELEEYSRNLTKSHEFIAGIVFVGDQKDFANVSTLPTNIEYKIRIDIDFVPSTKDLKARIWEPGPRDNYLSDLSYLHGFVQIQEMIDRSIMNVLTNRTTLSIQPEVHLQQQPYLCYDVDKFGNYIRSLAPLLTTMAWIFLIAYLIRENVLERELHLEEVMRVMGLKSGVAWLTWFIIGISVMAFATLCGISLLYIGKLIPASDPILLFIFFMVFNISLLMFCYMMSSLFKTATIAALSGIVAYLASFLPFMVAITLENEMNFIHKAMTCLSMSTSFCFGMMYMTRFEVQGVGMQWSNLWHSPMQGDTMSVGAAMAMMGVDSCLYFLVGWYISHVCPAGNNARRYPWLFFLSYSYWKYDFLRSFGFGEENLLKIEDNDSQFTESIGEHEQGIDNLSVVIENDTTFNIIDPEELKFDFIADDQMITDEHGTLKTISGTLKKAIIEQNKATLTRKQSHDSSSTLSNNVLGMELRGLYVIYNERSTKSKHIAVSNLNLTLKEGQITTILGRNGAGKTTAINVLTGQLPPTSGTVAIYGHRIPEDFGRARQLLGYCPQYNTLFDDMTVREHLLFFAELKGLLQSSEQILKDVDEILNNMGLWNMQHQFAKHLSGGLKRRLCVALAFVGGSKLIILDEPTASVDPVARRKIWDLIVQQKRSRTVLLTTHHMDEAEILSDEVAVIHRGKLLCVGSPLLLKSKYGCGYQLTVSKQAISVEEGNILDENLSVPFGCEEDSMNTTAEHRHQTEVERLMAFTKCLIPNASFVEDNSGEVILSLPQYDDHGVPHDYATFFRCVDSNIRTLGFGSYGVTSTTLEEVFLTLCNLEETNMPVDEAKLAVSRRLNYSNSTVSRAVDPNVNLKPSIHVDNETGMSEVELDSGIRLKSRQLYALLSKRFLHMLRDWKLLFCTLFLPCLFIAFAMAMTLIKPSFAPDPSLPMVPNIYGKSTVSFVSNNPESAHNRHRNLSGQLINDIRMIENQLVIAKRDIHKSISCLKPRDKWRTAKCPILYETKIEADLPRHLLTLKGKAWDRHSRVSCKCSECFGNIASMAYLIPMPNETAYGWIYNLSKGVDVNQFLLRTQPEFMDRRWGGWSFHYESNQPNQLKSTIATLPTEQSSLVPTNSRLPKQVIKVWYDNNGFHSMPSYLSALNNAILRANLQAAGLANASDYRITTYSHPLHVRSSQLGDQSTMQQAGDAGIAIIILVGFIFIPTSFVFYIVRERLFEEKHLQRTFGVGPCLYWVSSLLWDVTVLLVAIGFASAIIAFFRLPIYMARLNLPAVLALLFFFGWAMINLVYLMEKMFSEPSIAFMVLYCLALFVGIHTMVMRLMIDVFKLVDITPTIYKLFEKVAVFFPPYLLLSGIVDVHRNQLFADIFTLFDQDTYVNPFKMELLGKHFSIFFIEGVVFFVVNLAIECGVFARINEILFSRYTGKLDDESASVDSSQLKMDEDSDVAEERRRVNLLSGRQMENDLRTNSESPSAMSHANSYYSESHHSSTSLSSSTNSPIADILRVFSVTKVFESILGNRRAVNDITFSVPRGECFGLLGVNGAGKTTLFRILTGQVKATSGEASFNGQNIRDALDKSGSNHSIGYCPQADALDNFLTPIEHLRIYAHLRGIPNQQISKFVKESIDKFQLELHSTKPVQTLSRGNRRKLCLAIAMLGNPTLILLDEPTSGLDPQSRRYICQNIQDAIRDRRSILLTSHSMEECDILCSRLAIMVNGRFKCIGSPQYLKHKFGTGYIITLRLSEVKANFKEATEFIKENFQQSILRAHHHTMLEFNLPTNDIPLSNIFQVLQKAQKILSLQDYSVSQTTLDQVFVSFASQQVNDYETKKISDKLGPIVTNNNNNNTNGNGPNFASHIKLEAKHNLKRHASLLMSCCQGDEQLDSKLPTGSSSGNNPKKTNPNLVVSQLNNHNPRKHSIKLSGGQEEQQRCYLKNNLLLNNILFRPQKVQKSKNLNIRNKEHNSCWSITDYFSHHNSQFGSFNNLSSHKNNTQNIISRKCGLGGGGGRNGPGQSKVKINGHLIPRQNSSYANYRFSTNSFPRSGLNCQSGMYDHHFQHTLKAQSKATNNLYSFMKVGQSSSSGRRRSVVEPPPGLQYDFEMNMHNNSRHQPAPPSNHHQISKSSSHHHQRPPHASGSSSFHQTAPYNYSNVYQNHSANTVPTPVSVPVPPPVSQHHYHAHNSTAIENNTSSKAKITSSNNTPPRHIHHSHHSPHHGHHHSHPHPQSQQHSHHSHHRQQTKSSTNKSRQSKSNLD